MSRLWKRRRAKPRDVVIDLRSHPKPDGEYRVRTIYLDPPAEEVDEATRAWEDAASLVRYPSDLEEWRADRRRDDLQPGRLSAAVLLDLDED